MSCVHQHGRRGGPPEPYRHLVDLTVQGFRPKSPPYEGPVEFEPYPVGYVGASW